MQSVSSGSALLLVIVVLVIATSMVSAGQYQPNIRQLEVRKLEKQQQRPMMLIGGGGIIKPDANLENELALGSSSQKSSNNTPNSTSNDTTTLPPMTTTITSTHYPTYGPSQHIVSEATYESIIDAFSFFAGQRKVVFENCFNEYFFECRPALLQGINRVTYQWRSAQQSCLPYWCDCLGGDDYDNQTACMAPMSYRSYGALCAAIETCYPAKEHCANQFIYTAGMLPTGCDAFTNCSLQPAQTEAAYKDCLSVASDPTTAASKCDAEKVCQQMKDPLAPVVAGPGVAGISAAIPQALRDIWMATAGIFGLVLVVAVFGVCILRRRHQQWEQWFLEQQNMATERADEVVWFEPGTSALRDEDELATAIAITKKAEEAGGAAVVADAASIAAAADEEENRFDPSTCIRCGAPNAHIQLLPCRCRWCGCGSGVSVSIPGGGAAATATTETHSPRNSSSPTSAAAAAPAAASSSSAAALYGEPDADGMVEVSALSCKGLPKYTCKIPQSEAAAQVAAEEDEDEGDSRLGANGTNNNSSSSETDPMNAGSPASSSSNNNSNDKKCARPKCERCRRIVNFAIDYSVLFFPAASQDESVVSGADDVADGAVHNDDDEKKTSVSLNTITPSRSPVPAAVGSSSVTPPPEDNQDEQEDLASPLLAGDHQKNLQQQDDDDDDDAHGDKKKKPSSSTSVTPRAVPGPRLTAEALAPAAGEEGSKKKRRKKIPSCCICLSEPSSVAIISCAHVAQCVDCAKKLCVPVQRADAARRRYVISAKCPLCREEITAMVSMSEQEVRRAFSKSANSE